jgi:transcriptional regulator with XRE-family HTH domain
MRLRQYLTARKIPIAVFAARIGVSTQAVHRYVSGERLPRRDVMERIQAVTGGAVQPNDFFCCQVEAA